MPIDNRVAAAVVIATLSAALSAHSSADEPRLAFDGAPVAELGDAYEIAAADFSGDGLVDFAISWDKIRIHIADRAGSFTPGQRINTFASTRMLLGDFNGDGAVDIVSHGGIYVDIQTNEGNGNFTTRKFDDLYGFYAGMTVGDFDEDGALDVAAVQVPHEGPRPYLVIFRGDGTGRLSLRRTFSGPRSPSELGTGDFDADGHLDLAVEFSGSTPAEDGVAVVFGDGRMRFARRVIPITGRIEDLAVADVDGDGLPDVIATRSTVSEAAIARAAGAGAFDPAVPVPLSSVRQRLRAHDLDVDGDPDLVALDWTEAGNELAILRNDGSGVWTSVAPLDPPGGMRDFTLADVDGDGHVDIATVGTRGRGMWLTGRGDLSFNDAAPDDGAEERAVEGSLALADLDRDGTLDLVSTSDRNPHIPGFVTVRRGDGGGGFGASAGFDAGVNPFAVMTGDFDENGTIDVVVGKGDGLHGYYFLPGDGAGALLAPVGPIGGAPTEFRAVADLDRDGHLDLVGTKALFTGARRVFALFGTGAGSFGDSREFDVSGGGIAEVTVADFDADGALDIAASTSSVSAVTVLMGDGTRNFVTSPVLPAPDSTVNVVAADFDRDGLADLAVSGLSITRVFRGIGAGGFAPLPDIAIDGFGDRLVAADFNDDGLADLAGIRGELTVYVGNGNGGFPRRHYFAPREPLYHSLLAADLEGDGDVDLVAQGYSSPIERIYGVVRNLTRFEAPAVLAGNVNAAAGVVANVLFVNGSTGAGAKRVLEVDRDARFRIGMESSPALEPGPASFALYSMLGLPREASLAPFPPFGTLGRPLTAIRKRWNNTGDTATFGAPNSPSSPAPSVVIDLSRGLGREVTFLLQGFIADPQSPSGIYAVTNGVTVVSR